jgi:cytochrome c peroxidase
MKRLSTILFIFFSFLALLIACDDPELPANTNKDVIPDTVITNFGPSHFSVFEQPDHNPLTKRGVELGRMLFYDPILSSDSTISCSSCHNPSYSFTDNKKYSVGVNGAVGNIQAMAIVNLAWQQKFFWNGRSSSLEIQAIEPVLNPIEMHETPANVVKKLKEHASYPKHFRSAFGTDEITMEHIARALAQFERTMVSQNSKLDELVILNASPASFFTDPLEFEGFNIFMTERGECFHCHGGVRTLLTNSQVDVFRNNGLMNDGEQAGKGLVEVTGLTTDAGKFKVPILRNAEFSGPYMHDGRFNTLAEVVEFYSSGIKENNNIDPIFLKNLDRLEQFGGLGLSTREKQALVAFLKTLTDTTFINNRNFQNPFRN